MSEAARAAERVARTSYGRLVALLAYRWRDLAAAEDALSDAFAAALACWPRDGVPASPEAWLMTAARRRLLEAARHRRVEDDPSIAALLAQDEHAPDAPAVPDERLRLLYVCAHPAIAAAARAPLMLQAVLGLEARTIADAFLVSPAAMAQRLVRAKARIRETGLRFEAPEADELPARLAAVLESIYGAYAVGRRLGAMAADAGDDTTAGLTDEALFLGRLVVALQPDAPEPLGLLALMLHCEARRPAQFDDAGRFVPLAEQDTARWDRTSIDEAERALRRAAGLRSPGVFQVEAAIQSAHNQRLFTGSTPWRAIAELHGVLATHFPSIGAETGRAVALAECGRVGDGIAVLDALPPDATRSYQPYWVARAHLLRIDGRDAPANEALARAIGLTEDRRVRAFLQRAIAKA